jgi:hypothetical protein
MEITDVASYFRWEPVKNCSNYEIQIARDPRFVNIYKDKLTTDVRYHEDNYFPRDILPVGVFYWRVRAVINGVSGDWSDTWIVKVNSVHSLAKTLVRPITTESPVFLMRNRAFDPRTVPEENIRTILPETMARIIVPDDITLWTGTDEAIEKARRYDQLGIDFAIWNNRARAPLSLIEYLFQHFKHCIGTAEGEHFWSYGWEQGPEGNISEWDYVARAYVLCGKYGRYYFQGDGEPGNYVWTIYAHDYKDYLNRYHRNIVPMFKSTIGMVALHSLGATEGLMASGTVDNCGMWADEFIWSESGFGKLGEIGQPEQYGQGTELCPWTYDIQMWLMGIASGSTVFQLESAHQWTDNAQPADNYSRFFLPFVTAVVKHHLLPSRQAFLQSIKAAVTCDYAASKLPHNNKYQGDFACFNILYALKGTPFQETIPDNSRYGIICLLPPGAKCLNSDTKIIPEAQLKPTSNAVAFFDSAYPNAYSSEAFQWQCDGTIMVTNSNENKDIAQQFTVLIPRGPVTAIDGAIGVHQYVIGKTTPDNRQFWFQTNCEYPERTLQVTLSCTGDPKLTVAPAAAEMSGNWNSALHSFTLTLSVRDGPAEVKVQK